MCECVVQSGVSPRQARINAVIQASATRCKERSGCCRVPSPANIQRASPMLCDASWSDHQCGARPACEAHTRSPRTRTLKKSVPEAGDPLRSFRARPASSSTRTVAGCTRWIVARTSSTLALLTCAVPTRNICRHQCRDESGRVTAGWHWIGSCSRSHQACCTVWAWSIAVGLGGDGEGGDGIDRDECSVCGDTSAPLRTLRR